MLTAPHELAATHLLQCDAATPCMLQAAGCITCSAEVYQPLSTQRRGRCSLVTMTLFDKKITGLWSTGATR